jgi:predicted nucleic acid-binding protein
LTRLVVDASVAVKWFLPEAHTEAARRALGEDHELLAPDLIAAEFGNALWKRWRRGEMDGSKAAGMLRDFTRAPIEIVPSSVLMAGAWSIAQKFARSFYDSLYLALAVRADCPLLTADRQLYNAFREKSLASRLCWVEDLA